MPAACFSDPMTMTAVKRGACGALFLVFTAAAAVGQNAEKLRNHFDADGLLREPAFFDFLVLGPPGEAEWKVVFARNAGHCDRPTKLQTLPQALEWVWQGFKG